MLTRKIGKMITGNATPFQIAAACVLGTLLAFVPSFTTAPGWLLALVAMLLLVNANLGLALLVGAPMRLVYLLLVPALFQVGRFLLDGPTAGLFQGIVNAPFLAWFGLEHYVTTGGILVGSILGGLTGWGVNRSLSGVRRKLASLEEGSPKYQALMAKRWVKILAFLFVGGRGKKSWEELLEKRRGNPVRIVGLVLVVIVGVGFYFARRLLAEPIVTHAVKVELEEANGATVEIGTVALDLEGGRLTIRDLVIADPEDLSKDLLRAGLMEADLDVSHLLRKRLTFERIAVSNAVHGAKREKPAERVGPRREPVAEKEVETREGEKSLEEYLEDAKVWKERLAQVKRQLQRVTGGDEDADPGSESLRDRLERRILELGYARIDSEYVVTEAPTLTIGELVIDGLTSSALAGEVLDLKALNLSTHPHLLAAKPQIDLRSRSGNLAFGLGVDGSGEKPEPGGVHFRLKGLPVDRLASSLVIDGQPLLAGGTIALALDGSWSGGKVGVIDLPLRVTLNNSSIQVPGRGPTAIEEFVLPIGLRGPLDAPRVRVDGDQLRDSLVKAGAKQLAGELEGKARAKVDEEKEKAKEAVQDKAKKALGDKAKGLFGGGGG